LPQCRWVDAATAIIYERKEYCTLNSVGFLEKSKKILAEASGAMYRRSHNKHKNIDFDKKFVL
jgi:hypothetical protein